MNVSETALVAQASANLAEEFRSSAERELGTANQLKANGSDWPNVYWHAGYSVELMLKAMRIKSERLTAWPLNDKSARWHILEYVVERCGLTDRLKHERNSNKAFRAYWLTAKDWDHGRRYPPGTPTRNEAQDLLKAVANPNNGVMQCLRQIYQTI